MSGVAENTNTTPNDVRLVWLTRKQRDTLHYLVIHLSADDTDAADWMADSLITACEAWDAAPADPAEAVRRVALSFYTEDAGEDATPMQRERADMLADAVLAALGLPREVKP